MGTLFTTLFSFILILLCSVLHVADVNENQSLKMVGKLYHGLVHVYVV